MTQPLLCMKHVSKFYKTVIGVGDVDIELAPGAYGLIGPNGSGKTTFINLIIGMLRPSLGSVNVFGVNPLRHRNVLRRIGVCPASDILYPNINGLRWVTYMLALHGYSKKESYERAVESLQRVGMEANMHRPIGSYSLGMRQRIKLAQATAHDPELLILDEPFNGLDPIGRHELSELLRGWIRRGQNLILASHILHEVEAVTSSFLLIHGGRVLASGNASEVRNMLAGIPIQIELRGCGLTAIATRAAEQPWLSSLQFADDQQRLVLQVTDHQALLEMVADVSTLAEVLIESIQSPDGTLQSAFELLLQVHRGEHRLTAYI